MTELWLPGARTMGSRAGLTMNGAYGIRRCTTHITWDRLDPRPSFDNVANYLVRMNYEPTLMWNPENGDFIQFFGADRGGYALEHHGVETNRQGEIHVQVEVYFSPGVNDWERFTDGPMIGVERLVSWLDQLDIPRTGPACDGDYSRDVTRWLGEHGYFGHINAPGNTHTDPAFPPDMARLFAAADHVQPLPPPAPIPALSTGQGGPMITLFHPLLPDRADDLWVGPDNKIMHRFYMNGAWSTVEEIPGDGLGLSVSASWRRDGKQLRLVVEGVDGHPYENIYFTDDGTWFGWRQLPGSVLVA